MPGLRRPLKRAPVLAGTRRLRQQTHASEPAAEGNAIPAARITAVAALLGALLGAVGAGVPALVISHNQIGAEESRSRSEFLRQQQQTVYATFIADQAAFREAEETWYHTVIQILKDNPQKAAGDLEAARNKFGLSYGNVLLVGSPAAVTCAEDIDALHNRWRSEILNLYALVPPQGPPVDTRTPDQQEAFGRQANTLIQLLNEQDEATNRFVRQARVDLGAE